MSSDPPSVEDCTKAVAAAANELGDALIVFARSILQGLPHRDAHQGYNIFQLELALNEARLALLDAEGLALRGLGLLRPETVPLLDPPSVTSASGAEGR